MNPDTKAEAMDRLATELSETDDPGLFAEAIREASSLATGIDYAKAALLMGRV